MKRFNGFLVAAFMLVAMLLPNRAQALPIVQFDKMAVADQSDYVGLLIGGAEQVLNDEGRADLPAKVEELFTTTDPGDKHTIGMVEFEINLARAREADAKRVLSDPNAPRLEVEDALAVTLLKNHIDLPHSFYTVLSNFKPKYPAKQ